MLGMLGKMPIGVLIDSKYKSRRAYSIFANLVIALLNFALAFKVMNTPEQVALAQFLVILVHVFID